MKRRFWNCLFMLVWLGGLLGPGRPAAQGLERAQAPGPDAGALAFTAGGGAISARAGGVAVVSARCALQVNFLEASAVQPAAAPGTPGHALQWLRWAELWPGISLTYQAAAGGIMESVYRLAPGAAVERIRLGYSLPAALQADGSLALGQGLAESAPRAWQEIAGRNVPVEVAYRLGADGREVGFRLGGYDPAYPITIDPVMTLINGDALGGSGWDRGESLALDAAGNIYVAGITEEDWGISSPLPKRTYTALEDCFVAKLSNSGSLLWYTFLGGMDTDECEGVAVSSDGSAVYAGGTSSAAWDGGAGTLKTGFAGVTDGFIVRLAGSTGVLQWVTFVGGTGRESGDALALDGSATSLYLTGRYGARWGSPVNSGPAAGIYVIKISSSTGLPGWHTFWGSGSDFVSAIVTSDTPARVAISGFSYYTWGSPVRAYGGGNTDVFVAELDAGAGGLQWNTFLGGSGADYDGALGVDASHYYYVSGESMIEGWGSPILPFAGTERFFLAKLNPGGGLQWNTFFGGTGTNYPGHHNMAVSSLGDVYMTGYNEASWGSPFYAFIGGGSALAMWGSDGMVAKFNSAGAYQWHSFIGGTGDELMMGSALDAGGNLYLLGTSSASWGTSPVRAFAGGVDGFVAKLNPGGLLQWHTFLGGGSSDVGTAVALDDGGNFYLTGIAGSFWEGGYNAVRAYSGDHDCYVLKLNAQASQQWLTFLGGSGWDGCSTIAVDSGGNVYVGGSSSQSWTGASGYAGGYDAFVAQLNSSGALGWARFLGGTGSDSLGGLALDAYGVYVSGSSSASWGASPVRAYSSGYDVFVAALNLSGALQWHTFLGGAGSDENAGLALGASSKLYVAGDSSASWGGTPKRAFSSGQDAFMAVMPTFNGVLMWHTYLGGAGDDYAKAIAMDSTGAYAYLTGDSTASWGSPVRAFGGGAYDQFVSKVDASSNAGTQGSLAWNTFLGGAGTDLGRSAAVGGASSPLYVSGVSSASWGSLAQVVRSYGGGVDGYLAGLNQATGALQWILFLGGSGTDYVNGITASGKTVYLTGSTDYPWGYMCYESCLGGTNAWWMKAQDRYYSYLPMALK